MRFTTFVLAAAVSLLAGSAAAVPFWGAKESSPVETDPAKLKPGQFIWDADAAPAGPIVVVVSLVEQRAYVYRNGIRIGVTTVSSGRGGFTTPTGVFTVLQKDKDHHSNIYHDAAMPFTERLTWGGISLHAGGLPGYPSSHGCVHLPSAFAAKLFDVSPKGMVVVISDAKTSPENLRHPAAVSPIDATAGQELDAPRLAAGQEDRWTPEASPEGPVSILVSAADQRAIVYRNGVEIGRTRIQVRDPSKPLGTHAFVFLDPSAPRAGGATGANAPRWTAIGVPGHMNEKGKVLDAADIDRVVLPADFKQKVRSVLVPGDTLVVTDAPVLEQTTGVPLTIVTGDSQDPAHAKKADG
jgi:hypothetical protein